MDFALPVAPVISSISPDTNAVGDSITDVNVLTLTGSTPANSTVNVYDGSRLIGTAAANATGSWSFLTSTLLDGTHSFTATDTVAGNTSAASSAWTVSVDTVAPVAPAITSFSTDSGTVGDGITSDNTLTLVGTGEANSTINVYDGSTLLGTTTVNSSGAWNFAMTQLTDGAHIFTATDMDVAGNISLASSALSVTIDTHAPVAPVIASFSPDTNVVGDGITSANVLTLMGTVHLIKG